MVREEVDNSGVLQCTRLFEFNLQIRGSPEATRLRKPRIAKRNFSMSSRRLYCNEENSSDDKENMNMLASPTLSTSPQKKGVTGFSRVSRLALGDSNCSNQDSGYSASSPELEETLAKAPEGFVFARPRGVAPQRMSVDSDSPGDSPVRRATRRPRRSALISCDSSSSDCESTDDGFVDITDSHHAGTAKFLPMGISGLLSNPIVSKEMRMNCDTPEFAMRKPKRMSRHLLSAMESRSEEPLSKVRACLFGSPKSSSSTSRLTFQENCRRSTRMPSTKSCKRAEPETEMSPVLIKRSRKANSLQEIPESATQVVHKSLADSELHAQIKSAITRSTNDAHLTGDFSKSCILPLAEGQHTDLKSISSATLASLIRGEYSDFIGSYTIVDCRYPYEYEGGHIEGAVNLYSQELIEQELMDPNRHTPQILPDSCKRNILVFHCEFSYERGPNLSRFLRNIDRQRNAAHYPALHYPEVYLLHGGYQEFFKTEKVMCFPQSYKTMKDPEHEEDLRQFRRKSKTWQGERPKKKSLPPRSSLKRLGF